MKQHKDCEFCRNNKPFKMPDGLVEAFLKGDVVIFAGAGVSTENRLTFPYTLYDEVLGELNEESNNGKPFSSVMSAYVGKKGRLEFLDKIKSRFDYIESFPELYRRATEFHRELATIPMVREIVTTNWDEYFEKECGARPYVNDEDIAFIDVPERRVLKIHGSINNIGSIVATKEDYAKCKKRLTTGLLGSKLKLLLANKTLVFIGYSFTDEDFQQIYDFVQKKIGELSKEKYLVTLNEKDELFLKKRGLKPIYTAGTYFLHQVRKELSKEYRLLPIEGVEIIEMFLKKTELEHNRLTKKMVKKKSPENFYCQSYQDGLIHAYEYVLNKKRDGYTYDLPKIFFGIDKYESMLKEKKKLGRWWDVAYIRGYQMGLLTIASLGSDKLLKPETYYNVFHDGHYPSPYSFARSFRIGRKNEKSIIREFNAIIKKHSVSSPDIVFHHTPFLF